MNVNNNSSSKQNAMKKLQEASFASYDTLLYLDSHPCDKRALRSFEKYNALRREAAANMPRCTVLSIWIT